MSISLLSQIALLPKELQDLIYQFNVEHRPIMNSVFKQLLKCVMCGPISPETSEAIYIDKELDGTAVICCDRICQEDLYYRKRIYHRYINKKNKKEKEQETKTITKQK